MKGREWTKRNLPLLLAGLIIVALVVIIQSFRLPGIQRQTVLGCVLVGSKEDMGWNENHYNSILNACRAHGCGFAVRERVAESGDAVTRAVAGLVKEGANVIFLTSFGNGAKMDEMAQANPRVAFFGISGERAAKNATTYFARLYHVRYLAGVIAGAESKTGVLGYVAAMPNAQTNRGINAYAMGMRFANPNARLIVRFTGSWDDEAAERESVARLQQEGADVITYHTDKPCAIEEAEKRGLMSVGYEAVHGA